MAFFKYPRHSADYLIILLCLVFANVYCFASSFGFYPAHDSMNWLAHFFYVFYNEYFINDQFPLWLPYTLFGQQADYYIMAVMSPAQYFMAFLGKLLGIQNALLALSLSMLMEQLAYVTGMWFLCRRVFTNRLTVLFVSIGAVFTVFWGMNFGFNFRFYYLAPFVLFLIIKFFDSTQVKYLWGAAIFAVVSLFGNAPYYIPVYLFIYGSFFLVMFFTGERRARPDIKEAFSPASVILFTALLALAFMYVDFVRHMMDNVSFGLVRESGGGVSLDNFLKHGGLFDEANKPIPGSGLDNIWQFLYAAPWTYDFTVYIGLLPIIFLIYAFLNVRKNPVFNAVIFCGVSVFLIAIGQLSFVSPAMYVFFPFMDVYRHITYLPVLTKFFFLIAAGFGLDYFLEEEKMLKRYSSPVAIAAALGAVILFIDIFVFKGDYGYRLLSGAIVNFRFHYVPLFVIFIFALYLLRRGEGNFKKAGKVIVLLYFFEIASYSTAIFFGMPVRTPSEWAKESFKVSRHNFQSERYGEDVMTRLRPNMKSSMDYESINKIPLQFSAFYADPCPDVLTDYDVRYNLSSSASGLFKARFGVEAIGKSSGEEVKASLSKDEVFLRAVGCNSPKLSVVSSSRTVSDMEEAASLVRSSNDLDTNPVIYGKDFAGSGESAGASVKPVSSKAASASRRGNKSNNFSGLHRVRFQQSIGSATYPFWETTANPPYWLAFELAAKGALSEYALHADIEPNIADRMPADWILQASDDGVKWTPIDSIFNQIDWKPDERRGFKIKNRSPYKHYRIYVTKTANNSSLLRLGWMELRFAEEGGLMPVKTASSSKDMTVSVMPVEKAEMLADSENGKIVSVGFSPNALDIVAESYKPDTRLVYLDNYHPAWKAVVNGAETQVERANIAFKAVKLKEGRNEIKLAFAGNHRTGVYVKLFFMGGILSCLYILTLAVFCATGRERLSVPFNLFAVYLAFAAALPLFITEFGVHNDYSFIVAEKFKHLSFDKILFGFKDESPHLIMVGRPVNAFLMGILAVTLDTINSLAFVRFLSFISSVGIGILMYLYFVKRLALNRYFALSMSAGILALPSNQTYLIWVTNFIPGSFTVLIVCASYFAYDFALANSEDRRRFLAFMFASFALLLVSLLIYPPNALFFLVFTAAGLLFSKSGAWEKTRIRTIYDIAFCGLTTIFYFAFVKLALVPAALRFYPQIQSLVIEPQRYAMSFSGDIIHKAVQFKDINLIVFGMWFHAQFTETISYAIMAASMAGVIFLFFRLKPRGEQKEHRRAIAEMAILFLAVALASNAPILLAKGSFTSYRLIYPYGAIVVVFIFWLAFEISDSFRPKALPERFYMPACLAAIVLVFSLAGANLYSSALSAKKELSFMREKLVSEMPWNTVHVLIVKPPWGGSFVEPVIKHEFNYMSTNYNDTPLPNVILQKEMKWTRSIGVVHLGKRFLMNDLYKDPYREFRMDDSFKTLALDDTKFLINMNDIANSRVKGIYSPLIVKGESADTGTQTAGGFLLLKEGYKGFNIIQANGGFYAILQNDGAFDLKKAENKEYAIAIKGDSIKSVMDKIDSDDSVKDFNESFYAPILADEGYRGFNIVQFKDKYYAIPQSEGAFELSRVKNKSYSKQFISEKIENVRAQIDELPREPFSTRMGRLWKKVTRHLYGVS